MTNPTSSSSSLSIPNPNPSPNHAEYWSCDLVEWPVWSGYGMAIELNKTDIPTYFLRELYNPRFKLGLYPDRKIRSKSGETIGQVQYLLSRNSG